MMNDLEKVVVALVNELVSANAMRKETVIEALVGNSKSDSSYVLSFSTAKKIVEKINSCDAISNQNFALWCRSNKIKIKPKDTLELCLKKGVFSYRSLKGTRYYYVKNGITNFATIDDIVWR